MVIFLYNLYIFIWIQHDYLDSKIFALDPSNSVIKKLWCNLWLKFSPLTLVQLDKLRCHAPF